MIQIIVQKFNELDPVVHPKVSQFFIREEFNEKVFCIVKPVNNPHSKSRIVFEYPFSEISAINIIPE